MSAARCAGRSTSIAAGSTDAPSHQPDQVVHLERRPHGPEHPQSTERGRLHPHRRRHQHRQRSLRPAQQLVEIGPVGVAHAPALGVAQPPLGVDVADPDQLLARRAVAVAQRPRLVGGDDTADRRPGRRRVEGQAEARRAPARPGPPEPACRRPPRPPTRPAAGATPRRGGRCRPARRAGPAGRPSRALIPAPRGTSARSCSAASRMTAETASTVPGAATKRAGAPATSSAGPAWRANRGPQIAASRRSTSDPVLMSCVIVHVFERPATPYPQAGL